VTGSRAPEVLTRPGREDDLSQLNDFFNYYVRETPITFHIEPITMEQRREWFGHYHVVGRHRMLVAAADDRVIGFAASSPFRPMSAYDPSVQTSIGRKFGRYRDVAWYEKRPAANEPPVSTLGRRPRCAR
jgi:phosphinothricin acetyltransferase